MCHTEGHDSYDTFPFQKNIFNIYQSQSVNNQEHYIHPLQTGVFNIFSPKNVFFPLSSANIFKRIDLILSALS